MCTKWSIEYAQIVTNMQQLLHLCIRDVNARACLVTPLSLQHSKWISVKCPEFGAGPKSNQVQVNGFCRVFQVFLFALHD